MSFFVELWESVFTPGTTPALVTATHASFIVLLISLSTLIYITGSIHFINLFVIAALLYGAVVWFIGELQEEKLKSNQEIATELVEEEKSEEGVAQDNVKVAEEASSSGRKTRSATKRKA